MHAHQPIKMFRPSELAAQRPAQIEAQGKDFLGFLMAGLERNYVPGGEECQLQIGGTAIPSDVLDWIFRNLDSCGWTCRVTVEKCPDALLGKVDVCDPKITNFFIKAKEIDEYPPR